MVLYEPAFALLVRRVEPSGRASALLSVTIVAGFASSIFLPLTGLLVGRLGWRDALLVLAVLHGAITIPLHALGLRGGSAHVTTVDSGEATSGLRDAWTDRGFWLLVAAFTAHTAAIAVMSVHLVTYLVRLGHPPGFAASVAGGLGVLSVTGRVVTTSLRRRWSTATVTAAVFGLQAVAVAVLPVVGRSDVGALACVMIFGLGFGVATIARPAMLADRYGAESYAGIAGALALPVTVSKAAAPLVAAVLATSVGGYTAVMAAAAGACALAASLLAITGRHRAPATALGGHPDAGGPR
jgi:predicted MFS family arabinose efflux permease